MGCREAELANLSETWRRLLADFRPVAKAAAERTEGARNNEPRALFRKAVADIIWRNGILRRAMDWR